jgi:hypothetical protein
MFNKKKKEEPIQAESEVQDMPIDGQKEKQELVEFGRENAAIYNAVMVLGEAVLQLNEQVAAIEKLIKENV